jgi:hypothetical protein
VFTVVSLSPDALVLFQGPAVINLPSRCLSSATPQAAQTRDVPSVVRVMVKTRLQPTEFKPILHLPRHASVKTTGEHTFLCTYRGWPPRVPTGDHAGLIAWRTLCGRPRKPRPHTGPAQSPAARATTSPPHVAPLHPKAHPATAAAGAMLTRAPKRARPPSPPQPSAVGALVVFDPARAVPPPHRRPAASTPTPGTPRIAPATLASPPVPDPALSLTTTPTPDKPFTGPSSGCWGDVVHQGQLQVEGTGGVVARQAAA